MIESSLIWVEKIYLIEYRCSQKRQKTFEEKFITDFAEKESCVIVGRCADYILQDIANCLTVFIHASNEQCAESIVSFYGEREESAVTRIYIWA